MTCVEQADHRPESLETIADLTFDPVARAAAAMNYLCRTTDAEFVAAAERIYRWVEARSGSFGWVTERIEDDGQPRDICEICCLMDMVDLQMLLAERGQVDLYEVAGRYAANQLAAAQLTPDRISALAPTSSPDTTSDRETNVAAIDRLTGGFINSGHPGDFARRKHQGSQVLFPFIGLGGCCGPAGVKALYRIWQHAVRATPDGVEINLLVDHLSPWVDVKVRVNARGRVHLVVRDPRRFLVRPAHWAEGTPIRVSANGAPLRAEIEGNVLAIPERQPGDTVTIDFAVPRRTTEERLGGRAYQVEWLGDWVVGLDVPDARLPVFADRRGHIERS